MQPNLENAEVAFVPYATNSSKQRSQPQPHVIDSLIVALDCWSSDTNSKLTRRTVLSSTPVHAQEPLER